MSSGFPAPVDPAAELDRREPRVPPARRGALDVGPEARRGGAAVGRGLAASSGGPASRTALAAVSPLAISSSKLLPMA